MEVFEEDHSLWRSLADRITQRGGMSRRTTLVCG
jgi:hypothetical protein